jgi:hypothetical protein
MEANVLQIFQDIENEKELKNAIEKNAEELNRIEGAVLSGKYT